MTRLGTAVVGAGPAGLLFCLLGRILHPGPDWALAVLDKRATYARTHRLRMAPAPYEAIGAAVAHPAYDHLLSFLRAERFAPAVNRLEEHLSEAVSALGVPRHTVEVRADTPLAEVLAPVGPAARRTVVAADSVHSAVRSLVGAPDNPRATWQTVARLRVDGPGLPPELGVVDRYRLSKLLGSVLDYRLNPNGWAEIDLFLAPHEHAAVGLLHATPREPVPLDARRMSGLRAPLLRRMVEHLQRGFGQGACSVALSSTFRLEHAVAPRRVFPTPDADVFLLGDAAVSLPFFRGMACLARCAHALAEVHRDLLLPTVDPDPGFFAPGRPLVIGGRPLPGRILAVHGAPWRGRPAQVVLHRWLGRYGVHVMAGPPPYRSVYRQAWIPRDIGRRDLAAQADPVLRYDAEVARIAADELAIVRARGRLLAGVREFVRVSALLPFPVQDWFLSTGAPAGRDHWSPGLALNALVAGAAAGTALAGLPVAAAALQLAGGVTWHASLVFEAGPHRYVRRVWELQIAALFAFGLPLAWFGGSVWPAVAWLVLAGVFVLGLYTFEALAGRWYTDAALDP